MRILVIDDQPRFLRAIAGVLRRWEKGLEVEVAASGADGLLRVGLFRPHVILLDAQMDGLDGFDVCRLLKKTSETRHILIIGISGTPANDALFREAGADQFLLKPITGVAVLEKLRALGLVEAPLELSKPAPP